MIIFPLCLNILSDNFWNLISPRFRQFPPTAETSLQEGTPIPALLLYRSDLRSRSCCHVIHRMFLRCRGETAIPDCLIRRVIVILAMGVVGKYRDREVAPTEERCQFPQVSLDCPNFTNCPISGPLSANAAKVPSRIALRIPRIKLT